MKNLNQSFYETDGITLAQNLLGKIIVRKYEDKIIKCIITETEAYCGPEDKGCHAFDNKKTKRTFPMFLNGGKSYIYLIYGMYYCFNVVANKEDIPHAVLIRSVEPIEGLEIIKKNRNIKSKKIEDLTNGPGKLCIALNIDKNLNTYDLTLGEELYIEENSFNFEVFKSKRINIDYAEEYKDKLWRFYIKNNKFVSK